MTKAKGVDDAINSGMTLIIKAGEDADKEMDGRGSTVPKRPEKARVLVNNTDPEETLKSVLARLKSQGNLYSHQGKRLVTVGKDDDGTAALETVGYEQIGTILIKAMIFYTERAKKVTKKTEGPGGEAVASEKEVFELIQTIVDPPETLRRHVVNEGPKHLPIIRRIASMPMYTRAGRLIIAPGLDEESGIYYEPTLANIPLNPNPTQEDARASAQFLLKEIFSDFPFESETDKCHALAATLQPFVQGYINGPTPAYLFSAPTAGTGKSLCAEACALLGCTPELIPENKNDDELRKTVSTELMQGPGAIILDNFTTNMKLGWFQAILTGDATKYRLLGGNDMEKIPNKTVWMITANGPRLHKDTARRTVPVNLDARMERPWERDDSRNRHPELKEWILENRPRLVGAALTALQGWFQAGAQRDNTASLGSFRRWSTIMGGIMRYLGIQGFLSTQKTHVQELEEEADEWMEILNALAEHCDAQRGLSAHDIWSHLNSKDMLPEEIGKMAIQVQKNCLGRYLKKKAGRNGGHFGDYFFTSRPPEGKKKSGNLYTLQRIEDPQNESSRGTGEAGGMLGGSEGEEASYIPPGLLAPVMLPEEAVSRSSREGGNINLTPKWANPPSLPPQSPPLLPRQQWRGLEPVLGESERKT